MRSSNRINNLIGKSDRIFADKPFYILLILIIATLGIHVFSLMRFPEPFVDEAWLASRAWGFLHTGFQVGQLDQGIITSFDGYWTIFPWVPTVIQALGLYLSDVPSLYPVRAISLIFGTLLLVQVYLIALKIGDRNLAALSVFLVVVSRPFFISSHIARVDVIAAALGFTGITVYIYGNKSRIVPGILSGLFIGIAIETHVNALIYILPILFLSLYKWSLSILRIKILWGLILGLAISSIFYLSIHIFQFPDTYFYLNKILFFPTRSPPILFLTNIQTIITSIVDFLSLMLRVYLPLLPLVIIAVGYAISRRSEQKIDLILIITATLALGFILIVRNKILYYSIAITPAVDMLVALGIIWIISIKWKGRLIDFARLIFLWGSLFGYVILNNSVIIKDSYKSYLHAQSQINEYIPKGSAVIGPQTYWFGLFQNQYYSWEEILYYQRIMPGSSISDSLEYIAPEYFIVDGHLESFITYYPRNEIESRLYLPKAEFDEFLNNQGTLLTSFQSADYGRIRIFHLEWDNN